MDVEKALERMWQEVAGTSARRVADRIGVSASTLTRWKAGTSPEGEQREKLLTYVAGLPPLSPVVAVIDHAQRKTAQNIVRLSKISGQAEAVLRMMQSVTAEQARVVESLRPWVQGEEDVEAERHRAEVTEAAKQPTTPIAAKAKRRPASGQ